MQISGGGEKVGGEFGSLDFRGFVRPGIFFLFFGGNVSIFAIKIYVQKYKRKLQKEKKGMIYNETFLSVASTDYRL